MSLKLAASLLGQRRYAPLWAAQTLGAFNDNLFRYTLVTLAAYEGLTVFGLPREEMAPIATAMFTIPIFLFSAVAGQVADRYDRTKIMRTTKFAEIFLMAIATAGFLLNQPILLLLTLFLMGVQTAVFLPARTSAMPTLLDKSELVTGNATLSGAVNVAILLGAIGGTLLIAPDWGIHVVCGLLLVCAVIGWVAMREGAPAKASNPDMKIRWNIVFETVKLLGVIVRAPRVLRPALGVAWFWTLAAAVLAVLPLFVRDVMGGAPSAVTIFQVLFTIGAALGALITGALNKGGEGQSFTILGAFGLLVFPLFIALSTLDRSPGETLLEAPAFVAQPENLPIIVALFFSALAGGLFLVPMQAMTQGRADPERRGRLLAAANILNGAGASMGPFVLVALSRAELPIQGVFVFVALGSGLVGLVALARSLSRTREAAA
ncbi:MAG: MFS transporter [Oceanicaulis sp.]